jgi:hypothetical protein
MAIESLADGDVGKGAGSSPIVSIYATLWALQFPRFGEFHIDCEWVTVNR